MLELSYDVLNVVFQNNHLFLSNMVLNCIWIIDAYFKCATCATLTKKKNIIFTEETSLLDI